jgi:hypothetical protein
MTGLSRGEGLLEPLVKGPRLPDLGFYLQASLIFSNLPLVYCSAT